MGVEYIERDCLRNRFRALIIRFILAIGLLIIRPSLARLLMGWDGLGVTSYLLVSYYRRETSFNASILTALVNRVGDVALLLAISINVSNILNYGITFSRSIIRIDLGVGLVLLARITKRAQVPFSAWLPAAMAAPTPVSALVHSSTLVTAGVYLIIRLNFIFCNSKRSRFLLFIGIITILLAGAAAILEIDIKKVIALSTLSQLGVIIIILGGLEPILSFFHLLSHAYFKAILFICAGIIIHNIKDYQDIRKIRIILSNIPITIRVIIVANLSLCGLPFLRGFYSKDIILESIIISRIRLIMFIIMIMATFFTAAYSCRISFLLATSFTAKDCIYISDDNDYLIIRGIVFLLFLIFTAILTRVITLKTNKSNNYFIKFFIGLILFFPQTFRILSNIVILGVGKSKLKLSESR